MRCFKGFNRDLQCTPGGKVFQYELGKDYEEKKADLCSTGFHACESPLDVLGYYGAKDGNRFCEVDLDDVADQRDADSKRAGTKIHIGAEVGLKGLIQAAVKFVFDRVEASPYTQATSGDYAHSATSGVNAHSATSGRCANSATSGVNAHSATSGVNAHSATSGDYAHSATSGVNAHSATSGRCANSATSGNYANSATSGDNAHSATSGVNAHSATSGDYAHSATSGRCANSATSGNYANSATSGNYAHSATSGRCANSATSGVNALSGVGNPDAVAASIGINAAAKGVVGSWIAVAEWAREGNGDWHVKTVNAAQIDGEELKPDTFYAVKDGEFVEVE